MSDCILEKSITERSALDVVKAIGLNQEEMEQKLFTMLPQYYDMFTGRLEFLKRADGEQEGDGGNRIKI